MYSRRILFSTGTKAPSPRATGAPKEGCPLKIWTKKKYRRKKKRWRTDVLTTAGGKEINVEGRGKTCLFKRKKPKKPELVANCFLDRRAAECFACSWVLLLSRI